MSLATYLLWNQNSKLSALNQAFEIRNQEQKLAIESLQNDFTLQTNSLLEIQSRNQEIQQEMSRYLDIFKRHDLTRLAAAKPGLIQPRINKGTKDVFDDFLLQVEKDQGQMVFVAMSVPDYELMAYNMQELKRYINELTEVVVYYRKVTVSKKDN